MVLNFKVDRFQLSRRPTTTVGCQVLRLVQEAVIVDAWCLPFANSWVGSILDQREAPSFSVSWGPTKTSRLCIIHYQTLYFLSWPPVRTAPSMSSLSLSLKISDLYLVYTGVGFLVWTFLCFDLNLGFSPENMLVLII